MYNWIFLLLILNPLIVFSINRIFSLWINIELNLIIFIIYMVINNNKLEDLPIKYFLLNSFRSIFFFLIINFYLINKFIVFIYIINLIMFLKLGIFPFHYWFINIIIKLNWMRCFFLSIWQKLIPLIIIYLLNLININFFFIILNIMIRLLISFREINLKKILGYSSINHLSWIIIGIIIRIKLFILYYFIYFIINLILIYNFYKFDYNYLIDFNNYLKKYIFLIIFLILSLGGIPPFWGFYIKFILIYEIIKYYIFFFIIVIIFFSLFYLYYYLRLVNNFIILNFLNFKNVRFKNININCNNFTNYYNFIIVLNLFNFLFLFIWIFY